MKTTKKAFDIDKLIKWLESNKGQDRFYFSDKGGEGDPVAARNFAEAMRANVGSSDAVQIEQSGSKVTISLVGAACKTE